jgi:hypothetical protein
MKQYLRQPFPAACVAFLAVYLYLTLRVKINGEPQKPNHYYFKPSFLVAVLVYFIVYMGQTDTEPILGG